MVITVIEHNTNESDNVGKCPFCQEILIQEEKLRHCILYHNAIMILLFEKVYKQKIKLLDWLMNKPYIVFE